MELFQLRFLSATFQGIAALFFIAGFLHARRTAKRRGTPLNSTLTAAYLTGAIAMTVSSTIRFYRAFHGGLWSPFFSVIVAALSVITSAALLYALYSMKPSASRTARAGG